MKGDIDNIIIGGTSIPHFQKWIDHPDRKSIRKHWT